MISAWSSQQRLVLGQCKVADKSNEITAIPELLQLLELHGAVVTIDAMGCQRTIAAQIIDQKADYVFGLKGNQGTLHKDVALLFDERQDGFAGHAVTLHESFEKGHGRLETRRVVATDDLAWLQKDHQWPGMRSVAKVESRRELLVEGKVEEETRYYISSLPGDAKQIWPRGAQPLGRREWAALGDGHGVPRRRVPHTERARAGQLRHHQAHGQQSAASRQGQTQHARQSSHRWLG